MKLSTKLTAATAKPKLHRTAALKSVFFENMQNSMRIARPRYWGSAPSYTHPMLSSCWFIRASIPMAMPTCAKRHMHSTCNNSNRSGQVNGSFPCCLIAAASDAKPPSDTCRCAEACPAEQPEPQRDLQRRTDMTCCCCCCCGCRGTASRLAPPCHMGVLNGCYEAGSGCKRGPSKERNNLFVLIYQQSSR